MTSTKTNRWSLFGLSLLLFTLSKVELRGQEEKASPRQWNCLGSPELLPLGDPSRGEIPLDGAAEQWNAFHLYTSDTWRLHNIGAGHLTKTMGSPQVIVMDEVGRCVILQEDSGKWSPHVAVEDEGPTSAWANGDLDTGILGTEIYVGGRSGRIFRVFPDGRSFRSELVLEVPDVSFSMFILGEFDVERPGNELIALSNNGPILEILPDPDDSGRLKAIRIGDFGTRCRDAVLLPARGETPPRIAALLQTGVVSLLSRSKGVLNYDSVCDEPMSIARLSRRPERTGSAEVLYVARTDGLILRFQEGAEGSWKREAIYAGPSGPRGLAAGHFNADHDVETVAVFGYSKKVQVVSRREGENWDVQTVFRDTGGGHWLTAAELDGRNNTDELVGGGFSFHVFMVTRVPGDGLEGVAADPDRGIPDYPIPGSEREQEAESERGQAPTESAGKISNKQEAKTPALFSSDFEDQSQGSWLSSWQVAETNGKGRRATWEVVAKNASSPSEHQVAITRNQNSGSTFNLLLTQSQFPADIKVEVELLALRGLEDQGGGIVWRAKDQNNYYVTRWNPLEKNLRAYKVEQGQRSMIASCHIETDSSDWHRLAISMRGPRGTVSFDGSECLVFEDSTFPTAGAIGLWSKADAQTAFDSVVVESQGQSSED